MGCAGDGPRERVVYKHAPTEDAGAVLRASLPAAGVDPGVLSSGQVQLADTTDLRADTGGRHDALYALHLDQLRKATRDGFAGLALTGDAAAMHTITRDEAELAGYERDLERLAGEAGVRSLCRYPVEEEPGLLDDMLTVHFREVTDVLWSAEVIDGRLWVRGELDFSNVDRFVPVVRTALAAGIHTIDASAVEFCDVAVVRALVSATDALRPDELPLTLVGVDGVLAKILAATGALGHRVLQVSKRDAGA
ncbi:MEDS domain-containing protein [Pseudonocardia charpentierae]|uniref:MEDS domain-containing protein n=1 Tax=Pseudonocardia charpentierae TaxID=3075545 RepID=A0ABU2NK40_9PSEU|nr:MEDS domain-containing protein [Pseudonocardia sp. DSM 45834]MDT0354085.1 MEDS domain-containing protein [Pseudonocardia sp. DSM 45834]